MPKCSNHVLRLGDALAVLKADLEELLKGEACDHAVGVCWCGYYRDLQLAEEALTKAEDAYTGVDFHTSQASALRIAYAREQAGKER